MAKGVGEFLLLQLETESPEPRKFQPLDALSASVCLLTSVWISSNSGPTRIWPLVVPLGALPNADPPGLLSRKAILALSKVGDTVLTSRFNN